MSREDLLSDLDGYVHEFYWALKPIEFTLERMRKALDAEEFGEPVDDDELKRLAKSGALISDGLAESDTWEVHDAADDPGEVAESKVRGTSSTSASVQEEEARHGV